MPDRSYFEAEDFAAKHPDIEAYALGYIEAHPEYDIVTARQIIDTHPAMQAILGRTVAPSTVDLNALVEFAKNGDTLVAAPEASTKVGEYEWMGEVLELSPEVGYRLLAEYRAAAAQLHEAKARAKAIEAEIMETLQGFEHGAVNGQQVFHWPIVDSTSFNAKAFKEDPERKALYDAFLVTKQTRRFKVDGTVGVD